jgi:collagenase-like PrtC family protease
MWITNGSFATGVSGGVRIPRFCFMVYPDTIRFIDRGLKRYMSERIQNRREIMKIREFVPGHFDREIIMHNSLNTVKEGADCP